ncbi:AMP-binding protein [Thermoactinomyces daqus]|uniref:AMP-binding protein n=1 Tax=Thermoactinomyces daqus TaxID=1329516 RepID=A0A7W1XB82_9BACL|nr:MULTISPECIES: AMP-binding protein [Thermoactinomyces]MBA4543416.1 AMP-binding protein [Thermoactinomyces daqus]MBH8605219.1 AMP-binding protein [Thermoactinomyces sp. CICC 10522]
MKPHNLLEMVSQTVSRFPDKTALLWTEDSQPRSMTYQKLWATVRDFAFGLERLGIKAGSKVAIISENHPRFLISDLAILSLGAVSVPIHPLKPAADIKKILLHSEAEAVLVGTPPMLDQLDPPSEIRHTILLTGKAEGKRGALRFETVIQLGQTVALEELDWVYPAIQPPELAAIVYQQGVHGKPKGAMLSHANILSHLESISHVIPMVSDDIVLSALPASSSLTRLAGQMAPLRCGATIAYTDQTDDLLSPMIQYRPTIFIGSAKQVERLYNLVHSEIERSQFRAFLFRTARRLTQTYYDHARKGFNWPIPGTARWTHTLAHTLVFSKWVHRFGGRLRFLISDQLSLSDEARGFFETLGLPVITTHNTAACTSIILASRLTDPADGSRNTLPGIEYRFLSDGELLVKSASVMMGYYNRPEKTQQTIVNGWLHTREFAEAVSDGQIKMTGLRKNCVTLSDGTLVDTDDCEDALNASPLIERAVLLGNARPYITALITPDPAACAGKSPAELEELIKEEIDRRLEGFSLIEKPKRFALLHRSFSQSRGELTSTQRLRLPKIEENYAEIIEAMYSESTASRSAAATESKDPATP